LVLDVTQTTTRTFWDDKVVSANIVEEVSILNLTSPANQLNLTMDNTDNFFNFLNLNNMQTIIASNPKVDFEFGVILSDGVTDEWVVMGSFYIDNWKNNRGQMTITFTAHDLLNRLGNVSFNQQAINNAYDTAVAVLQNANITDYDIDVSLKNVLGSGRLTWSTNSRDLLQQIALATGMTLYQDRYGTLRINKFPNLSQASTYTTFTTGQASLFGSYASPSAVSKQDTDNGMRALTLEQMYDLPEVTLDQSVYQVKINVYSTNPNDSTVTEYVSTNPTIQGNNGQSFSLDIPLVQSTSVAQAIADSIFADTNYNAIYVANWRQNPVLMATDVIVINDSETSAKQTRVTKQEFNYVGYLSGTTESRGGI
jgi:hypothetical protein